VVPWDESEVAGREDNSWRGAGEATVLPLDI